VQAKIDLAKSNQPNQLFAQVHIGDRGSDAIYVHTENPNGTEFPAAYWGKQIYALPSLLSSRVDLNLYNVYVYGVTDERFYTIELKRT
jgi:hypothetical protein